MTTRLTLIALLVLAAASTISSTGTTTGSGFLLNGTAVHALDPENPANDVIKIDTTSPDATCTLGPPAIFTGCKSGTVSRKLNVKIFALDNQLEFKSYFAEAAPPEAPDPPLPEFAPRLRLGSDLALGLGSADPPLAPRSCGGGSPRIQLAIDLNGDGISDGNAFGHVRPPFAGCPPLRWNYDDVTDEEFRWDVSQLALNLSCPNPNLVINALCPILNNSGYIQWAVLELALSVLYPMHKVCSGALVDDSGWMPGVEGVAYYDVVSLGRATWHAHTDTAGRGFARGCAAADHPDDDHDGDCDRDHDVDDHDGDYDRRRRDRWGD